MISKTIPLHLVCIPCKKYLSNLISYSLKIKNSILIYRNTETIFCIPYLYIYILYIYTMLILHFTSTVIDQNTHELEICVNTFHMYTSCVQFIWATDL